MRLYWLRLSTWRLNTCGRRESVLCTNGIYTYDDLIRYLGNHLFRNVFIYFEDALSPRSGRKLDESRRRDNGE